MSAEDDTALAELLGRLTAMSAAGRPKASAELAEFLHGPDVVPFPGSMPLLVRSPAAMVRAHYSASSSPRGRHRIQRTDRVALRPTVRGLVSTLTQVGIGAKVALAAAGATLTIATTSTITDLPVLGEPAVTSPSVPASEVTARPIEHPTLPGVDGNGLPASSRGTAGTGAPDQARGGDREPVADPKPSSPQLRWPEERTGTPSPAGPEQ